MACLDDWTKAIKPSDAGWVQHYGLADEKLAKTGRPLVLRRGDDRTAALGLPAGLDMGTPYADRNKERAILIEDMGHVEDFLPVLSEPKGVGPSIRQTQLVYIKGWIVFSSST
ncbi:hypothetical protein F4780DRAFT_777153 [Xylariomycetidae sp. FL0641]|nr:hypothetical protein F4780DRAFT_777153 [Xylariomycetidae sp. FL0641]